MRGVRVIRRRRLLRAAAIGGLASQAGKGMGRDRRDEESPPAHMEEADVRAEAGAPPSADPESTSVP
jgi:hypothetical protein